MSAVLTDQESIQDTIIFNMKMIESYMRKTADLVEQAQGTSALQHELESGSRSAKGWIKQLENQPETTP